MRSYILKLQSRLIELQSYIKAQVVFCIDSKTDENYNCERDYNEEEIKVYLNGKIDAYNDIIVFINNALNESLRINCRTTKTKPRR